jgi:hypothetical protein
MNQVIRFSFLEITNQDFSFSIYRKAKNDNNKSEDEYSYRLPLNENYTNTYGNYLITFYPKEGFRHFVCKPDYNYNLTKKWLMSLFIEKTKATFDKNSFWIGNHFIPNVSFVMKSFKEGIQLVTIEPYYLSITKSFGFLLEFKFKPNKGYENTLKEKIYSLSITKTGEKNRNFYADKLMFINAFIEKVSRKIFPIIYQSDFIDVEIQLKKLPFKILSEKSYIFKNGIHKMQFQGLKDLGPLKTIENKPIFIFIFEKSKVNTARELVKALRGETYTTFIGMQKMFQVEFTNENIIPIQTNDFNIENLYSIEKRLDEIQIQYPKRTIVGIFAGIAKDFDATKSYSPYYTVKNIFLKKGFAVQAVTMELALKKDGFKWSISSIALQLFVKLGGIPWKVKPQNDNCIIFGISSAHIIDDNKKIRKYFAYSVCFDSSGIFKQLDILSSSESENTYIENLSVQIKKHFSNKLNDTIRKCVIHIPFKLNKREIKCIKESVEAIKSKHQNIEFVFIKINIDNRFFGYSEANSKIPIAGSYIKLADKEFLVWFEGLHQGRETVVTAQNISNPVHIQFMDASDIDDAEIEGYLQDVINLSGANWRGFNAKHTPVSIYYPELIAKFIGKFEQYGLEIDLGIAAIDKAWFL